MNIRLNLATRPYFELRPILARLRIVAAVLAVLAIPMFLLLHSEQAKATAAEQRVAVLNANIATLRAQQETARERITNGPDADVLRQAAFLNTLFQRKSFSWTATMSDLEDNLPAGVQVQEVEPVLAKSGQLNIQMRVIALREHAIEVIRNLEHSRHFAGPRLVGEALANENTQSGPMRQIATPAGPPKVTFDILAGYRPLPPVQTERTAAVENKTETATDTDTSADTVRPAAHVHRHKPMPGTAAAPAGGR